MSGWTPERRERAKDLYVNGWSASQIAKELGAGLSRNAIIGVLTRMKVSTRDRPTTPDQVKHLMAVSPVTRNTKGSKPGANGNAIRALRAPTSSPTNRNGGAFTRTLTAVPLPPSPAPEPNPQHRTLLNRHSRMCCFPVGGQGADTLYCCAPLESPSPDWAYCAAHLKVMGRVPATEAQKAAAAKMREAKAVKLRNRRAA